MHYINYINSSICVGLSFFCSYHSVNRLLSFMLDMDYHLKDIAIVS